jgi:hypothetical protein
MEAANGAKARVREKEKERENQRIRAAVFSAPFSAERPVNRLTSLIFVELLVREADYVWW